MDRRGGARVRPEHHQFLLGLLLLLLMVGLLVVCRRDQAPLHDPAP